MKGVEVKLLPREGELYVLAQSRDRVCKERAIRRRQLKKLWKRLKELQAMEVKRDQLLIKLGQAKSASPKGWRLVEVEVSKRFSEKGYESRDDLPVRGPKADFI